MDTPTPNGVTKGPAGDCRAFFGTTTVQGRPSKHGEIPQPRRDRSSSWRCSTRCWPSTPADRSPTGNRREHRNDHHPGTASTAPLAMPLQQLSEQNDSIAPRSGSPLGFGRRFIPKRIAPAILLSLQRGRPGGSTPAAQPQPEGRETGLRRPVGPAPTPSLWRVVIAQLVRQCRRKAYPAFGPSPRKCRCSSQHLARMLVLPLVAQR